MDSKIIIDAFSELAKDKGIDVVVFEPKMRKFNIRNRGYGENFATNRKCSWTH